MIIIYNELFDFCVVFLIWFLFIVDIIFFFNFYFFIV